MTDRLAGLYLPRQGGAGEVLLERDRLLIRCLKDRKRRKPYYAKFVPEGETKQRYLPGSSSEEAWEAACKLAYYEATKEHEQLPAVIPNDKKRRTSEVCARCL